jgi:PGF-CTERM protein
MRPARILGGAAVLAVLALVALVVLAPGAIADDGGNPEPPGDVSLREVSIAPGETSGATATLRLDARLQHHGGTSENVSVEFRAIDGESALLENARRVSVGNVSTEGERSVRANLSVERSGGYRIETVVYRDGRRVDSGTREVSGVGSLDPEYREVGVAFHDFEDERAPFPPVEYSVERTDGNRVTVDVSAYVTNSGDGASEDLEMVVVARQSGSGIVADRATVRVGEIRSGRTVTPAVELTVPDEYDYYLDAMLKRDDVMVSTARASADLTPGNNRTVSVNASSEGDGLEVGDFTNDVDGSRENGENDRGESPRRTTTASGGGGPGFGPVVALVAVLAVAVIARRKKR